MKEMTIYTAVDGAEFRSKDECLNHENQLIFEKSSVRLWDKYGKPITEFSTDTFDKVYFISNDDINLDLNTIVNEINQNTSEKRITKYFNENTSEKEVKLIELLCS